MSESKAVAEHYERGDLLSAIEAGVVASGKRPDSVAVDDLAPVDEFHIGGREASAHFVGQLGISGDDHVLDVGCGIGGTSRFVAQSRGARVTGIDLTPEFVATGTALCGWVGLSDRIELVEGSALDMPFEDGGFDAAIMLHVGMNLADKARLFAEVHRVLRPGATFGVYDVMRTNDEPLAFPVPWASGPDTSFLNSPAEYRAALTGAGFEVASELDRRDFAVTFFDTLKKRVEAAGGPPPLGLHIVLGADAPTKVRNMVANIAAGRISPVEMIARKAG